MTVMHEHYDRGLNCFRDEYHGALICLADTELCFISASVTGPYEIREHQAGCKRMKHLDAFMPAATRDKLISAFEMYTGHKPDVVPGFWTVIDTCHSSNLDLYSTWSLGTQDSIAGENCDSFGFGMLPDSDDSDA
ncbi:hypothetical protein BGZ95_003654 [Linnemannia exigua]|uniref:Uncharacterized protein n=1 Tax=Linnemannia exigua TaxID=604196 RepID=A0AAD4H2L4_9FUNG|nr:hypothetical protein BGZ95_003654 [Linnemannia exigua]